eukprot:scaffold7310_cov154-Skeletonema_dohrnii-CCMP3373.AAC.2
MWQDIERISGVPFSRSASFASSAGRDNSPLTIPADADAKFDARRLESLRIALDKENQTNSSIQIELNQTKVALLDATSRANDLEQTNNLLQHTIDTVRAENDTQRHDLLLLTASDASKDTRLEQLHDQVNHLQTQLSDLANANNVLTTEHSQTRHDLEQSTQRNVEHESKIERLELSLSDAKKQHVKDKEAAQMELKQTRMILQTKLQHAQEQLKESEARERRAHEARSKAADELPKLMAKFKSEREAIRAELTKLHDGDIEKYKTHLENASTQLKEMDSRLAKQAEEFGLQLNDAEEEQKETSQALQAVRAELEEKRSQCKRLQEEVVQLKDDVTCHSDKFQNLQEEKAEESQASQALIDRLQRQVQETKELLEKERSANAATLTRLENTLIAMDHDMRPSRDSGVNPIQTFAPLGGNGNDHHYNVERSDRRHSRGGRMNRSADCAVFMLCSVCFSIPCQPRASCLHLKFIKLEAGPIIERTKQATKQANSLERTKQACVRGNDTDTIHLGIAKIALDEGEPAAALYLAHLLEEQQFFFGRRHTEKCRRLREVNGRPEQVWEKILLHCAGSEV